MGQLHDAQLHRPSRQASGALQASCAYQYPDHAVTTHCVSGVWRTVSVVLGSCKRSWVCRAQALHKSLMALAMAANLASCHENGKV